MSNGVNSVILSGNLGADPELHTFGDGSSMLNMRLATNESWRDKRTGEIEERTEWHTVILWSGPSRDGGDNRAQGLAKILTKGFQITVQGKLQTRKWKDKEDRDRWSTNVIAFNVVLGGERQRREQQPPYDPRGAQRAPTTPRNAPPPRDEEAPPEAFRGQGDHDDIPF